MGGEAVIVIMETIGKVTLFAIGIILSVLYHGYALSVIWGWFFVPTFGLAPLNIPAAIGISLVISHMTTPIPDKPKDESFEEGIYNAISKAIVKPSCALLFGWIIKHWM